MYTTLLYLTFIIAGSVAYYFLYSLPQTNKEKLRILEEQQKKELQLQEEQQQREWQKEEEAKEEEATKEYMLQQCLQTARESYELNWANACASVVEEQKRKLNNCYNTAADNRYMDYSDCDSWYPIDESPDCSLPSARAESIEEWKNEEEDKCFKLYGD